MAQELTFGKTVESTTDNGQATICTDLESTYTQMGLDMMANILMTKKMGLGFINGQTEENTKVGGVLASNMDLERIMTLQNNLLSMDCGKEGGESNGLMSSKGNKSIGDKLT